MIPSLLYCPWLCFRLSQRVVRLEEVLIFVKVLVSMSTLCEINKISEIMNHFFHYLQCELICALACLGELLVVVTYLDLR